MAATGTIPGWRAVIGQSSLPVWAAVMPRQIVDSQYNIKKLKKGSVICRFSVTTNTLQSHLHFANTAFAMQSFQNRSYPIVYVQRPPKLYITSKWKDVNRVADGSIIKAGSGLIMYDTSICCGDDPSLTLTHLVALNCFAPPHGRLNLRLDYKLARMGFYPRGSPEIPKAPGSVCSCLEIYTFKPQYEVIWWGRIKI